MIAQLLRPPAVTAPDNSAASATAPAGSATVLARSINNTTVSAIASSDTVTTSSTRRRMTGSVRSPGARVRRPSAIVSGDDSGPRKRSWNARCVALAPLAWTPNTRRSGLSALAATAIPAIRPPPPMGTTSVSTSGAASSTSRATVPWPAITSGSSNGCTYVRPSSSATRSASACASSKTSPERITRAP